LIEMTSIDDRGEPRNALLGQQIEHDLDHHNDNLTPGARLLQKLTGWSPSRCEAVAVAWRLGQPVEAR
jgi:hypothetical protein